MPIYRSMRLLCLLPLFATVCRAQVATGLQPHGTLITKGADVVNVGNNNVFLNIPILTKQGRGTPFMYSISLNSSVWYPVSSGSSSTWQPVSYDGSALGWQGINPQASQGASYSESISTVYGCRSGYFTLYVYEPVGYLAPSGGFHAFEQNPIEYAVPAAYSSGCPNGPLSSTTPSLTTYDGSGYTGTMTLQGSGSNTYVTMQLKDAHGNTINPPVTAAQGTYQGSLTSTDANGNQITGNAGQYTDTTGTTALSVVYSASYSYNYGQHGEVITVPAQTALQYNLPNNANASYTAIYETANVATSFGCPGVGEYGPVSTSLVSQIVAPDGSTYQFGYEATPGQSGNTTGRISYVKLPTGGTIQYQYSGGNNGISCYDGSTPTLTRTTTDGTSTFVRSGSSGSYLTNSTVIDEKNNQSVYTFATNNTGVVEFYETDRKIYQGSATGTPLQEISTCFNNCNNSFYNTTITEIDSTSSFNGGSQLLTKNTYDSAGVVVTKTAQYSGSTLLESTTNSYTISPLLYELNSTTVADGSGNIVALTSYGYDETSVLVTSNLPQHTNVSGMRGNLTSTKVSIDGTTSNTLNTSSVYYDTGQPQTSTVYYGAGQPQQSTPTGVTTYGYDSTQTFITSITMPTPSSGVALGTSANYDIASGALNWSQGPNANQKISLTSYDNLLRPIAAMTPENGSTAASYTQNQVSFKTQMNTVPQYVDKETFLDSYGRVQRVAVANGAGWYLTDSCYDQAGMLQYQSVPYANSSMNPSTYNCSASTGAVYMYDALGRTLQTNMPDGDVVQTNYWGRAVEVSDNNGTTRITQYDLLGRISGICEVVNYTSMPGGDSSQPCSIPGSSFDISASGLSSSYAYSLLNHQMTITQGVQTRTFTIDAAGRTVSVVEPESGSTTYNYAFSNTGLQVVRTRPTANQTNPNITTTTTTQYDKLNRVVSVSYVGDNTPAKTFTYDQGASTGILTSVGLGGKGQLISISSGGHSRYYQYDLMGRVSQTAECFPGSCGNSTFDVYRSYGYDLASELTNETYASQGNNLAPVSLGYTYNLASQLVSVTGGQNNQFTNNNLYSASLLTPSGPQSVVLGNGLTNTMSYDAMNRMQAQWLCGAPGGIGCPGSSSVYGYSSQQVGQQVKSVTDTVMNRSTAYNYDQMGNLAGSSTLSGSGMSALNFSATYDRYGNRWTEVVTNTPSGVGPNQTTPNVNIAYNRLQNYGYDALGNVTSNLGHVYRYDAENNLIQVDSGSTASYIYDAVNERVQSNTGGQVQNYGFDAQGRRSTVWPVGSASASQVQYYAPGLGAAFWSNTDNSIHFEHQDGVGSERLRTTSSGTVEGNYASLPFGEPDATSGTDINPSHFAHLDEDGSPALQLSHATFREYDSSAGKWMNSDPYTGSYDFINPQSFNRYTYADNNPLSLVDPTGYSPAPAYFCISLNFIYMGEIIYATGACYFGTPDDPASWSTTPLLSTIPTSVGQINGSNGGNSGTAPVAPKNPCAVSSRVAQGIVGAANVGDAYLRAQAVIAGTGALAEAPPAAAVFAIYGATSVVGQATAGVAQLTQAFTGKSSAKPIEQAGNILAGPVSGVTTLLLTGGDAEKAEKNANRESFFNGGVGAVNKVTPILIRLGELALGAVGLGSIGCSSVP